MNDLNWNVQIFSIFFFLHCFNKIHTSGVVQPQLNIEVRKRWRRSYKKIVGKKTSSIRKAVFEEIYSKKKMLLLLLCSPSHFFFCKGVLHFIVQLTKLNYLLKKKKKGEKAEKKIYRKWQKKKKKIRDYPTKNNRITDAFGCVYFLRLSEFW